MKKLIAALFGFTLLTLASSTAFAQWWSAQARVDVRQTVVQAVVYNGLDRPIYCQGYAYGRTYSGHTLNAWGSGGILPGRSATIYVYTNPQNPFVNGWANIRCRTQ